ncbi:cytochrome c oxidase subunit 4 [Virgibacillus halotolerans]|uniref:cytochrome c oxidase subunit IVB n=1 Tax=Virgibacillus halotolerans TaxID=1071053 RepID=UPI001960E1CB|nr:cytochrome c oxidase subunit IVB [Virgibacillus halotolerans]MBM7598714.1 cytochrome c oxidase subunit 4 [Virgibacillus halotolerans]
MTDNTNTNQIDPFQKQKNKEELKKHLISFALMIVFTVIAFVIVASESMEKMFVIPLIIIMAVVQVGFQFYYFMHLKERGHEMPAVMIYGGVWCALLTLAALGVITWW